MKEVIATGIPRNKNCINLVVVGNRSVYGGQHFCGVFEALKQKKVLGADSIQAPVIKSSFRIGQNTEDQSDTVDSYEKDTITSTAWSTIEIRENLAN